MTYSFKKGLVKTLKVVALFAIPLAVDQFLIAFPEVAQLTVGGLLVFGANWLKVRLTK